MVESIKDVELDEEEVKEKNQFMKNKSWYDYDKDEDILWWGHPSLIIMVPEIIVGAFMFVIGFVLAFSVGFADSSLLEYNVVDNSLTYVGYGIMFLAVAGIAFEYLRIKATYYIVSDNKLWYKKGIIKRDSRPIHYDRLQHVRSFQDVIDRLVGIGSLKLSTAGTSEEEKTFGHIRNPDKVNKIISSMMKGSTNNLSDENEENQT